jgi:hypothetical protein
MATRHRSLPKTVANLRDLIKGKLGAGSDIEQLVLRQGFFVETRRDIPVRGRMAQNEILPAGEAQQTSVSGMTFGL